MIAKSALNKLVGLQHMMSMQMIGNKNAINVAKNLGFHSCHLSLLSYVPPFSLFAGGSQQMPLNDPRITRMLEVISEFGWPCTFHFQDNSKGFNQGMEQHLEPLLKRFPRVKFIGHAQSWWSHISAEVPSPEVLLYPKGPVKPGGLLDRLLADYENIYGDLSAGSGHGALARDEEFARGFLRRHRKKLLFASDCPCHDGKGANFKGGCIGCKTIELLDRLADAGTLADIFYNNAARLLGLPM